MLRKWEFFQCFTTSIPNCRHSKLCTKKKPKRFIIWKALSRTLKKKYFNNQHCIIRNPRSQEKIAHKLQEPHKRKTRCVIQFWYSGRNLNTVYPEKPFISLKDSHTMKKKKTGERNHWIHILASVTTGPQLKAKLNFSMVGVN